MDPSRRSAGVNLATGEASSAGTGALQEWRSGWHILIPCVAGNVLCSAHIYSVGVMMLPIEREFGWSRATISGGLLVVALAGLFAAPIAGRAVDRFGARGIALIGVPLYCLSLALMALASGVLGWWALWVLLALSNMLVLPFVWLSVINGYFFKSRGLAMAITLAGTGLATAIYPIVTNALVVELGWRGAYVALGALAFTAVFGVTWFLFKPAAGVQPGAARAGAPAFSVAPDVKSQFLSFRFFKLAGAATLFSMGISALTTNAVPVLVDRGLSAAEAAATAGLVGIGSIIGRLVGGYLLDRLNGNLVGAFCALIPVGPITILLMTDGSQAWAAIACFVMGLAIGAEIDCCAYLVARYFGTENFGTLFGSVNGLLLSGSSLAPIIANYAYDQLRSYDTVLIALYPLYIVASLGFAALGRYPPAADVTLAQAPG